MTLFNFRSLVNKYMTGQVMVKTVRGFYDTDNHGRWTEAGEIFKLDLFAIVPMTNDELKFDAGGTFNHDNRKLYCYKKFEKGDIVINIMNDGSKRNYKILSCQDYSDFDKDLIIYYLERTDVDG